MRNYRIIRGMHRKPDGQRGFTLIELLVVVSIIALLIAILLPSLSKARGRARTAACGSNVKQLAMACNLYAGEYGGVFPSSGLTYDANNTAYLTWYYFEPLLTGKYSYQGSLLQPYTQGQKVLFCPEMIASQANMAPVVGTVANGNIVTPYGMATIAATLSSQIADPTETASFGDSTNFVAFTPGTQLKSVATITRPSADTNGGFFHGRHNEGVGNASFLDGHVEALAAQLRPSNTLGSGAAAWQVHQNVSSGSLCYGVMDLNQAASAGSGFAAYAAQANLDFYFYYDKMLKN